MQIVEPLAITTYDYDEAGRMVRSARSSRDGALIREKDRTYDDKGRIVRMVIRYPDQASTPTIRFTHDDGGQWVREQTLTRDGGILPFSTSTTAWHPTARAQYWLGPWAVADELDALWLRARQGD